MEDAGHEGLQEGWGEVRGDLLDVGAGEDEERHSESE